MACNDSDRRQWQKTSPGRGKMSHSDKRGNAGRSCWGSVLIFQGLAKGLRKNQQTQPERQREVRGSQRIGMSKGVGCRSEGRQDLNSNDDDRGLRPKTSPGRGKMSHSDKRGNAGRSCWGSVLIFQGPDHQLPLRLPAHRNVKRCRMPFITSKRHLQRFRSTKQHRRCLSYFVFTCTTLQTLRRCT